MGEQINIAGPGSCVRISALNYERPATYETEPEWLSCSVECSVGPFHAEVGMSLATEDLRRFRDSLADVLATLEGTARMDTIEGRVGIEIEMGKRGNAKISGSLSDHSGPEVTFRFRFETDQSYLTQTLAETNHVLGTFPNRRPAAGA